MIILVDKPENITSHGVVAKIKYELKKYDKNIKVGHTGTLDPMCTGILPVLTGKDTKLASLFPSQKVYQAKLLLGRETDTEDITGNIISENNVLAGIEDVKAATKRFIGEIFQVPPMYSAIKINGHKLYEFARKGIEIERKGRKITIYSIDVFPSDEKNTYILNISCSAGTYIRTLCSDIGKELGCGGCMAALRRTVSNGFLVENARPLSEVISIINSDNLEEISISCEDVFNTAKVFLPKNGEKYYINGGAVSFSRLSFDNFSEGIVKVYTSDFVFCGLGKSENGYLKPILNYLN